MTSIDSSGAVIMPPSRQNEAFDVPPFSSSGLSADHDARADGHSARQSGTVRLVHLRR